MSIQIVFKKTLKRKGMTCRCIAEKVGVSPQTLSHLLSGRTKTISIRMIDDICRESDCQIEDILVFEDQKPALKPELQKKSLFYRDQQNAL